MALFATNCALAANDPAALQSELQSNLKDRSFILRNFYTNSKLDYDLNGVIQNKPDFSSWRLAGMRIDDVDLKPEHLKLTGKRVITVTSRGRAESFVSDEKIEVEVEFGSVTPDEGLIVHALNRIFLTKNDDVAALEKIADQQYSTAAKVGIDVSAPRTIYSPDPVYPPEARRQKFQGTVVLWVLIGADGEVRDVQVARPLGHGFDEEALKAVKAWRFTPALKHGTPVPVQLNVEVNFRLY